ncbi:RNA polymerase III [Nesidiocoris tenuis]|uniref:RNA polymerase III n=1 Tax=Nesidiocoris tenuis TaxID=355587 RepID=A0ABN7BFT3_9HEMI|nr:RNA polymerase III [Nesidiocoris tenuis]
MFILTSFKDIIRTPPERFNGDLTSTICQFLNEKFANKVVANVGLCVCLFDIESMDDSYIFPGDGGAHTKVEFRFVVFRPFIEEIIVGKVKNCSKEGVHATLGFFDDIFIPADSLQHPSRFEEAEQVWVWEYDNNGEKHDLFMDPGESIRFRVTSETFIETSPISNDADLQKEKATTGTPYSITATINEPGLGLLSWWEGS